MKDNEMVPDLFDSAMQGDSEQFMIAKELFNGKEIDLKTELTDPEINAISKGEFLMGVCNIPALGIFLTAFKRHRVSLKREGRKEFVTVVKNKEPENGMNNFAQLFKSGKL